MTFTDQGDQARANPELRGECGARAVRSRSIPNYSYIRLTKFASPLGSFANRGQAAALEEGIDAVMLPGAGKQMIAPDTSRGVAGVTDNTPGRDWADLECVGDMCSTKHLPVMPARADYPIARSIVCASPKPAGVLAPTLCDESPEADFEWSSDSLRATLAATESSASRNLGWGNRLEYSAGFTGDEACPLVNHSTLQPSLKIEIFYHSQVQEVVGATNRKG